MKNAEASLIWKKGRKKKKTLKKNKNLEDIYDKRN